MAVIIQHDPYHTLARRIGYSVGLEMLLPRVLELIDLYRRNGSISFGAFSSLVVDSYKREGATQHFAHFYGTLNLIRLIGKHIEALYQLDTLAILRELLKDSGKYKAAVAFVLTQCIIEADADVFLNALAADFDRDSLSVLLEIMIDEKDRRIASVFKRGAVLDKVRRLVYIKNESRASGHDHVTGAAESATRFAKRRLPLSAGRRTAPLDAGIVQRAPVSPDYVDKVSSTGRSWAEDLGLFEGYAKTRCGEALLTALLKNVVDSDPSGRVALFWGYTSDLRRLRITPAQLGAPESESWDVMQAIHRGLTAQGPRRRSGGLHSGSRLVEFLRDVYSNYRTISGTKRLIRNSLPMYIAEPVLAAWCAAEGLALPPLRQLLDEEFRRRHRRVQHMAIRGTSGALFFMGKK